MWQYPLDEDDMTLSSDAASTWQATGCTLEETCAFVLQDKFDFSEGPPAPGEEIFQDCTNSTSRKA